MDVGIGMQDSRWNTIEFTFASAMTQATQKSAASPNREQRDQAERRKTITSTHGVLAMLNARRHVPKKRKREHREAK